MIAPLQLEERFKRRREDEEFPPLVPLDDFLTAGDMLVGFFPGTRDEVLAICRELGFTVTMVSTHGLYLRCTWVNLHAATIERLVRFAAVRYVEPNYRVGLTVDDRPLPPPPAPPVAPPIAPPLPRALEPRPARFAPSSLKSPDLLNKARLVSEEFRKAYSPNDPHYAQQWGLENCRAPQAWSINTTSHVIVAVIDTGVDYTHDDLKANMWRNPNSCWHEYGADYSIPGRTTLDPMDTDYRDERYHGTHCAGIIGAVGNNGVGMTGIAWNARLMALKIFAKDGMHKRCEYAESIYYAVNNGAKVISASWGGGPPNQALFDALLYAERAGVLFVTAAGNNSEDIDRGRLCYPASFPLSNIIAVGAIDRNEDLWYGSNFGEHSVHIAAPGSGILSTQSNGRYHELAGTSMAAPHVAGAAALLWSHPNFQNATYREIKSALLTHARKLPSLKGKCQTEGTLDMSFFANLQSYSCPQISSQDICPYLPTSQKSAFYKHSPYARTAQGTKK